MDIVMIYRALCCILLWTISSFAMSSQSLDTPLQELEVGNLKGVVFYGKYNYSTGAAILELHPVVLFDQMMTEDLSVLVSGQDPKQHLLHNPALWSLWKVHNGMMVWYTRKKGWQKWEYNKVYPLIPANYRLNGTWTRAKYFSGATSVGVSKSVQFSADGRFALSGGVTANSKGSSRFGSSHIMPTHHGRYEIENSKLTLIPESGAKEVVTVITDDLNHPKALWINGSMYVGR